MEYFKYGEKKKLEKKGDNRRGREQLEETEGARRLATGKQQKRTETPR